MNVSLYDLLDVDPDATTAEIRAAWKAAIDGLDPTDRRFRAYNDAAAVLLDDDKRAAYDAELAAPDADQAGQAGPAGQAGQAGPAGHAESPVARETEEPTADGAAAAPVSVAEPDRSAPDVHGRSADERPARERGATAVADERPRSMPPESKDAARGVPTWALGVVAVLAVLSVALLVVVLSWPGSLGGTSPADREQAASEAEEAGASAENFAADAIPAVLSYDYRTLDEDFDEAAAYLTDEFAAKRSDLFDQEAESGLTLREQVVQDKVVVTAAVSGTGLTRVAESGDRATVVVFVDQDSQRGNEAPRSLRMWATLNLVNAGDGWLLDEICTETDCG